MYKVFIDKSCVLFKKNEKFSTNVDEIYHPSLQLKDFDQFSKYLSTWKEDTAPYITNVDPYRQLKLFFNQFKWIEAAGGIVRNTKLNKYLFIYRLNVWDLPKGKIERNESPQEAAVREVQEECGIRNLSILRSLPETFHVYYAYNNFWIKKTHWFTMETTAINTHPQFEEDIESVEWFDAKEVSLIMNNTYASLIDVIKQGTNLE